MLAVTGVHQPCQQPLVCGGGVVATGTQVCAVSPCTTQQLLRTLLSVAKQLGDSRCVAVVTPGVAAVLFAESIVWLLMGVQRGQHCRLVTPALVCEGLAVAPLKIHTKQRTWQTPDFSGSSGGAV